MDHVSCETGNKYFKDRPQINPDLHICLIITHRLPDKLVIVVSCHVVGLRLQHCDNMCPFSVSQERCGFWVLETKVLGQEV
jgi:hypothetical protein